MLHHLLILNLFVILFSFLGSSFRARDGGFFFFMTLRTA